jgi:hypothetical protein
MTAWPAIVERAAVIAASYDTPVTLRQLFYRLVAEQALPNTQVAYKTLSARTAEARREDGFPELADRGREIHRLASWDDPHDAMAALIAQYRVDRTQGQDVSLYLAVEKAGLVSQLEAWFSDLGVPILALGGYSSQSYVTEVVRDVDASDRPAILLYAGDFDPSGEDIDRDFTSRCGCFAEVVRIALDRDQVEEYHLPPSPGKATDPRAAGFVARHGELVQVELDALAPDTLHRLFTDAISRFWDTSEFGVVMDREAVGRTALTRAAGALA